MYRYFYNFIKTITIFIFFFKSVNIMSSVSSNYVTSAFNELVVVEPTLINQLKFIYSIPFDYARTTVTGSGSVTATGGLALVQTGTGSTGAANIRNKYRVTYRPGQGAVGMVTAIFTSGVSGSSQYVGVGNSEDGYFFGYSGAEFGILYRTNTSGFIVNNWIPQSSWNVDTMNGTGPSQMTLDPKKGNLYKVQYQWLGFGNIKFFIENPADGTIQLVHMIQYPNSFTGTAIRNPSLQTVAIASNSGNTGNISISIPCMASFIQGAIDPKLYTRYSFESSKSITTNTSIFGIQNPSVERISNRTNQIMVYPQTLSVLDVGGIDMIVRLYLNPTVSGASYTGSIATNSVIQYDTVGTAISGGNVLATYYVGGGSLNSYLFIDTTSLNLALAPSDTLVIAVQSLGAAVSNRVSLSWIEGL